MDLLEARGAARQDGHRHDARPRLRRPAVPAGAGDQPDGRRLRARVARPRPGRAGRDLRRPPAGPRRPGRRPRRRPSPRRRRAAASATSTSGGRDRLIGRSTRSSPLLATRFFVRALVAVGDGRARVRGRRHVRRAARASRSSATRSPRRVPGRRRRVPARARSTSAPRSRRSARRWPSAVVTRRARDPPGHGHRRAVRRHVRPRRVPVQHDPGLRRRPVQLPVRQRARDRPRRPRRAARARLASCWASSRCCGRSSSTRPSTRSAPRRRASGSSWLEYLFLALVALTIVVSLQAVGIILVVAMLVTPAATAQLLTVRFGRMMALARGRDRRGLGDRRAVCVVLAGRGERRDDRAGPDGLVPARARARPADRAAGPRAAGAVPQPARIAAP